MPTYILVYVKVMEMLCVIKHSCQTWKLANGGIAQHLS
jgi:hypothetical protein